MNLMSASTMFLTSNITKIRRQLQEEGLFEIKGCEGDVKIFVVLSLGLRKPIPGEKITHREYDQNQEPIKSCADINPCEMVPMANVHEEKDH